MSQFTIGLYDTETDTLLTTLEDGATIQSSSLTSTTTLVVIVDPDSPLARNHRSAVITLTDGETEYQRKDNKGPYSLFGDDNSDDYFDGIDLSSGDYEVTVSFHSRPAGKGNIVEQYSYSFTIVESPNTAPVAGDDAYVVDEDNPLVVSGPGVLGNDTDADGDALEVSLLGDVSNGTLSLNPDGSFTYTPDANFSGVDTFTYLVTDSNGGTDTGEVTINVQPVNDPPEAVDDGGFSTAFNTPLDIAAADLLANDSDVDGDVLSVIGVDNAVGGTVSLVGGTVTFTPTEGYTGVASFDYLVSDGAGGTATATVTLSVGSNTAPVAGDDAYVVDEDNPLVVSGPGVLGNDTDADGDALEVSLLGDVSNGTLNLTSDGSFTYTPDDDFNGVDSFIYLVSDGSGGTDTGEVTINVQPVNDAPEAADDSAETAQGVSVVIDVLANDSDVEDGTPDPASVRIEAADDASGLVKTVAGEGVWSVNTVTGEITFTPEPSFFGSASPISYSVADSDGLRSDPANVNVTVSERSDFSIAATDATKAEGDAGITLFTFTVSRSADATDAASVDYAVTGSGGLDGVDFGGTLPSGTVEFAPGETEKTLTIEVSGDLVDEADETFTVTLSNPSGDAGIATGSSEGVILNDDAPPPTPSLISVSFSQGADGYWGVVDTGLREANPTTVLDSAFSLRVDAGSGTDIQALVQFTDLFGSDPDQIPIDATIISAALSLNVTNSSGNGGSLYRMLTDWTGTSTYASLIDGVQTDGIEAADLADAVLGAVSFGTQEIDVTASLLAWADAGGTSTDQNDANMGWLFDTPSTDAWDFSSSESTFGPVLTTSYTLDGASPPVSAPTLSIANGQLDPQTEAGGAVISFTLTLDQAASQDVTVSLSTVNGTAVAGADFVGLNGYSVVFLAGETSKTIEVSLLDDMAVESPENFRIQIMSVTNAYIGTASAIGEIADDDGDYLPLPTIDESVVAVTDLTSSAFADVDQQGYGSGDPSGIAYVPGLDTMFIVDSEHNESPYQSDTNMFSIGPDGTVEGYSLRSFSSEPTGIAYASTNGYLYISDDDEQEIFWVDPADPSVALGSFNTASSGLNDTEDSKFDPATGHLFVLDGSLKKIFEFTLTGDVVNIIDLPTVMRDAEALAYDAVHDVFFVASGKDTRIWAIDRNGDVIDTIDVLADPAYTNPISGVDPVIKGMELAPSSDPTDGDKLSLYVADYGVDQVNDGRLLEIDLGFDLPVA